MNRDEFVSLPASMIAELLWPLIGGKLQDIPAPKVPFAPQWDMRLSRKGGVYIWASECDLETLQFYLNRAKQSSSPEFEEKNKKDAESLSYWVKWRQAFPSSIWIGTRGKKGDPVVTAAAPAHKPSEYQWEAKGGAPSRSSSTSSGHGWSGRGLGGSADPGFGGDDDIPFAVSVICEPFERWWR